MKCTVTLTDEVMCKIEGLDSAHHQMFYTAYGIPIKNHHFNPKVKLGVWDGLIRHFSEAGVTYQYLLGEIVPKIDKLGYDIEVVDQRTAVYFKPELIDENIFSDICWPDTEDPIVLYEHQVRVVNSLLREGRGIGIAATGAGKSLCCAAMAKQYNKINARVMVIVPSQDLIDQTRDDFVMLKVDTGEYSGDTKNIAPMSVISTWQALQHNPMIIQEFDVVIVDEAQGLRGEVLKKLLNEYGKNIPHRYGVTGTLPEERIDSIAVLNATGEVLVEVPAKELIEKGVLAKPDIHVEQIQEDLTEEYEKFVEKHPTTDITYDIFKRRYFPDYNAEKAWIRADKLRLSYIAGRIESLGQEGNTFVLVDGVKFGKQLASLIPGAVFVHGADKKLARKNIYKQFADNNDMVVIATVNIASTGINIKRIFNLCLVDLGKSYVRVIQTIGRGLRVAEDKDRVDVYDFCSDLKYGTDHMKKRMRLYKAAEYPAKRKTITLIREEK